MRKRGVEGRGTSTGKTHIRENTEKNMREKRHTFSHAERLLVHMQGDCN
jgi:hypothetical protein